MNPCAVTEIAGKGYEVRRDNKGAGDVILYEDIRPGTHTGIVLPHCCYVVHPRVSPLQQDLAND